METKLSPLELIKERLRLCMNADRFAFRQKIQSLESQLEKRAASLKKNKPDDPSTSEKTGNPKNSDIDRKIDQLRNQVEASIIRREERKKSIPAVNYDPQLPVCQRRDEIRDVIRKNQVVIICGETGSGKSTQLPKILLEMGLAVNGVIGHTQPRRIAARSIAARIAEEMKTTVGQEVGFKIRFTDVTSDKTLVKLMTDGILLAETQTDRFLDQYSVLIIDEAHERSLNIDFLLGYIKRILNRRRDLKVIITSATINAERFAEHFGTWSADGLVPAPIVTVSGRTYPVTIEYQPPIGVDSDEDEDGSDDDLSGYSGNSNNGNNNNGNGASVKDVDWQRSAVRAVRSLCRRGRGDILVFMPTEFDIHETSRLLRSQPIESPDPEILPLYARLSSGDQQKIFQTSKRRKIVIATNVAESSITVPGIRYVVDTGTARMSRYSARTKTQRLPIEPISQASADQRAGRCGRVGPGICVRLYSERDYLGRDKYTTPEIQRTNLASVILQTVCLRLGEIEKFPFIDPPKSSSIRDGYSTLFELGALDKQRQITPLGRRLSSLPVDPRIARMIAAAEEEQCMGDVLVIASALEMQDPRERPHDQAAAADAAHAQFDDPRSDFMSYLKLWDFYHHLKDSISRYQLRKACRQNFLSFNRMREWTDVYRQLRELIDDNKPPVRTNDYDRIHRSILAGLLSNTAFKQPTGEYLTSGGKFVLWPGSGLRKQPEDKNGPEAETEDDSGETKGRQPKFKKRVTLPTWLVAGEMVETTKRYLRTACVIDPDWIEPIAEHLVHRSYIEPHWEKKSGSAVAFENVSLFGLPIVTRRRVRYGRINPAVSRQLLIQTGLVEGDIECRLDFFVKNQKLLAELERLQAKMRRHDLLEGEWKRFEFYDQRIPEDVYDLVTLTEWVKQPGNNKVLTMAESDLAREELPSGDLTKLFPDTFIGNRLEIPIEYRFHPGEENDGVSIQVPMHAVHQISQSELDWCVPGLLHSRLVALIKSLPKTLRRALVPAPDTATWVASQLTFGKGGFLQQTAEKLSYRGGQVIRVSDFDLTAIEDGLKLNVQAIDPAGNIVAQSRDLSELMAELGTQTVEHLSSYKDPRWNRDDITSWNFGDLVESVQVSHQGTKLNAFPMLVDEGKSVSLRLGESLAAAEQQTRLGVVRLLQLACQRDLKTQAQWLPGMNQMRLYAASLQGVSITDAIADFLTVRAMELAVTPTGGSGAVMPVIRTEARFLGLVRQVKEKIGLAVQDAAALFPVLLENYHRAAVAAARTNNSRFDYAVEDVRNQLTTLMVPGFTSVVPYEWLRQYPRYFKAIVERLDALKGNALQRDRDATTRISQFWELYLQGCNDAHVRGVNEENLTRFRWLIEEYRVSCFAQKLGTAVPISDKRLEKLWNEIQNN